MNISTAAVVASTATAVASAVTPQTVATHGIAAVFGSVTALAGSLLAAKLIPAFGEWITGRIVSAVLTDKDPEDRELIHAAIHYADAKLPGVAPAAVQAFAANFLAAHLGVKPDKAAALVAEGWGIVHADLSQVDAKTQTVAPGADAPPSPPPNTPTGA
jgi:hypothetical protein